MINLQKLEDSLDKALAKETKKSLLSWLFNQRKRTEYSIEFTFKEMPEIIQDSKYILIILK